MINTDNFVNHQRLDASVFDDLLNDNVQCCVKDGVYYFNRLLTEHGIKDLLKELDKRQWQPVGVDGILSNYQDGDAIGSYRLSVYDQLLADKIWACIQFAFSKMSLDEYSFIESRGHSWWMPVGVNPLFRLIRYKKQGTLVPHYDAPYQQDDEVQTCKSLILYLTNNDDGGETRFLKDKQDKLPLQQRDFSDQFFTPNDNDIVERIAPVAGKALAFNHRRLHDSTSTTQEKIIIRTDIFYRKFYG